MATGLQHSFDFKLLFDSVAETNGCVLLDTLVKYWPDEDKLPPHLPKGCIDHWRAAALKDNSLTWNVFSNGLQEAFKADKQRLTGMPSQSGEGLSLVTTTQELERALEKSSKVNIVNALGRTRKEVYKSHKSINTFTSPRKERNHQRSFSLAATGQLLSKDVSPEEREKVVLQQLEELLRDRAKEKGITSTGGGMVNEVLQQLRSMLHLSTRGGGSYDQLHLSNPYATIRRRGRGGGGTHGLLPSKVDHSIRYHSTMIGQPIQPDRNIFVPPTHHPVDSEPPPPYSATAPVVQYPKRNSMSMTNLDAGGVAVPQAPTHAKHTNSTRQLLQTWKQAQTSGQPPQSKNERPSRQYVSSPDLSQEGHPFSQEELNTVQMYGTLSRKASKTPHQSLINSQSLQIQSLQNEKDILIKYIFHNRAQEYTGDDSILVVP